MDCRNIIRRYLQDNGYDGLCSPDEACNCCLSDLFECGFNPDCLNCVPAYVEEEDETEMGERYVKMRKAVNDEQ